MDEATGLLPKTDINHYNVAHNNMIAQHRTDTDYNLISITHLYDLNYFNEDMHKKVGVSQEIARRFIRIHNVLKTL